MEDVEMQRIIHLKEKEKEKEFSESYLGGKESLYERNLKKACSKSEKPDS